MDDAGAQHAHHVLHHQRMIFFCLFGGHHHFTEARGHVTVIVGDQLHQQHPFEHVVGLGHAHAGLGQPAQGIHLGALPDFFLLFPAELGAFLHGPAAAAVTDLAAFPVLGRFLEVPFGGFLVDLRAAYLVATADHEDIRLLATHKTADDLVDKAVIHQGL